MEPVASALEDIPVAGSAGGGTGREHFRPLSRVLPWAQMPQDLFWDCPWRIRGAPTWGDDPTSIFMAMFIPKGQHVYMTSAVTKEGLSFAAERQGAQSTGDRLAQDNRLAHGAMPEQGDSLAKGNRLAHGARLAQAGPPRPIPRSFFVPLLPPITEESSSELRKLEADEARAVSLKRSRGPEEPNALGVQACCVDRLGWMEVQESEEHGEKDMSLGDASLSVEKQPAVEETDTVQGVTSPKVVFVEGLGAAPSSAAGGGDVGWKKTRRGKRAGQQVKAREEKKASRLAPASPAGPFNGTWAKPPAALSSTPFPPLASSARPCAVQSPSFRRVPSAGVGAGGAHKQARHAMGPEWSGPPHTLSWAQVAGRGVGVH